VLLLISTMLVKREMVSCEHYKKQAKKQDEAEILNNCLTTFIKREFFFANER